MRAAVFRGADKLLQVETLPDPKAGPEDIIIKVGACGICGTDLHMTSGHGALQVPSGHILGHEFAGEIIEVGRDVKHLKCGDLVTAMPTVGCGICPACLKGEPKWCPVRESRQGGYGEYLSTRATSAMKLAEGLSLEDGAIVEPLAVGLHGVEKANMQVGDKVLIIGAGPVGLATLFWARRMGAGKVVVTASSDRRAALARSLGATAFVSASDRPMEAVGEALGGAPDIVFECVGAPGMMARSVGHVRPNGKVIVLGMCAEPDTMIPMNALFKEVQIIFAILYALRDFQVCIDTLASGSVEPRLMVTDRVSLEAAPAAFEALRRRTTQCKVLIEPFGAPLSSNISGKAQQLAR